MALIKCSECGRDVSSSAISCPACGYPISMMLSKNTSVGNQCNPEPGYDVVSITPQTRWAVFSVYCEDIVIMLLLTFYAKTRVKNYQEVFQRVKSQIAKEIEKNGISLTEMIEIEKRGGISSVQNERNQIRSSPQYKAWNERNDLVGEIIEKKSKLRNEREKVELEIQRIDEYIDRLSLCKKLQREVIVELDGMYQYAGFFDKMSIKARRNKAEEKIYSYDQMINAQQQERKSLYQQVENYQSMLSQLSDQCDQVIEQRDQFDGYYEKSRKLNTIIKGYNNSISLYNEYLDAKKKMDHDCSEMNKLISNLQEKVEQCFSLNIIPMPYRNLECMYWLNDYVSSSQPTELHQVFALMSLQKIKEEMQTTNNYLARIANGQEKQINFLNDMNKNLVAHRQEQKKAEQKYLEAFAKVRETISDGIMTIGNDMEYIIDQLDENGIIAHNQIDEMRSCNNMLSSIQLEESFYHENTISILFDMS